MLVFLGVGCVVGGAEEVAGGGRICSEGVCFLGCPPAQGWVVMVTVVSCRSGLSSKLDWLVVLSVQLKVLSCPVCLLLGVTVLVCTNVGRCFDG